VGAVEAHILRLAVEEVVGCTLRLPVEVYILR
jgi:hypothetical protein